MKLLAIGAVVIALVGIGIGIWALGPDDSDLRSMATPAVAALNSATAAIGDALGRPRATEPSPSPAPEATPIPRPRRSVPRASTPTVSAPGPGVEPESRTVEAASGPSESGLADPNGVGEQVGGPDIVAAPVEPYSARDTDVVAPKALDPLMVNVLPAGFRDDTVMAIEIVVNEAGQVDEAKAVVEPRTLGEYNAMLNGLSAAKTWRFQPATRQGVEVKYRLLVAVNK